MNVFKKIIFNVLYAALILGAAAVTASNLLPHAQELYGRGGTAILGGVLCLLAGGVFAGFFCVLLHETGHLLFGVLNGFKAVSFRIFNKEFIGKKAEGKPAERAFSYGSCELVSVKEGKYRKRYIWLTAGGLLLSLLSFGAYLTLNLMLKGANPYIYAFFSLGLIISLHIFLSALLPWETGGTLTDGALFLGLIKKSDTAIVMLALLSIQSQLASGKTPSEIEENLYFKLPVVPDGGAASVSLFAMRYLYYLDKGDYEKAAKVSERISESADMLQGAEGTRLHLNIVFDLIKARDIARAKATFKFIEKEIDDSITSNRILAYYYKHAEDNAHESETFAAKVREYRTDKELAGIVNMEKKLIDKL